jgi:hypothetical protein
MSMRTCRDRGCGRGFVLDGPDLRAILFFELQQDTDGFVFATAEISLAAGRQASRAH